MMTFGSLESLSRLGPKTVDLMAAGGGGGKNTQDELMGVLGLISDCAAEFVLLKYRVPLTMNEVLSCSQHAYDGNFLPDSRDVRESIINLHAVMRGKVKVISERRDWQLKNVKVVGRIGECALADSLAVKVCPVCRGVGSKLKGATVAACRQCDATGNKRISGIRYAQMLGIHKKSWETLWRWRYDEVMNVCIEWELEAHKAIMRERKAGNL